MTAKKKPNVWSEEQVQSTWTSELPHSSLLAQGVVLLQSWASLEQTFCKVTLLFSSHCLLWASSDTCLGGE